LASLRAFEAAARHLSFRKAADELAVTPTAISHQLRLLEETLGLPLFHRHVRRVSLTPAGAQLYPVLREGLDNFARAIAELSPQPPRSAVTISATTLFTARRLIPALSSFQKQWPQFALRLDASDDAVDLSSGAADIAVRYGAGPFAGLMSEVLCQDRFGVVCSPALGLRDPGDLTAARLIHSEWRRRDMQPDWRRWQALAQVPGLNVDSGLHITDESHAIQAAVAGQGAVITSLFLVEDELSRGVLVHPFGPVIEGHCYHLVATEQNMASADVRAVRQWLKAVASP
jgi:LysR family glycine cleavage system transcriptional activator